MPLAARLPRPQDIPPPVQVVREPNAAGALLNPERMRLLEALDSPASAAGLARRLGLPRQKVNYHLRELEAAGLVALQEERRVGNCIERVVRATARSFLISPEVLGAVAARPAHVKDKLSASYLVALAAETINQVAQLSARADASGRRLATLGMETEVRFASAEQRAEFTEELVEAVMKLVAKYHDAAAPGGRRFRVVLGAHPVLMSKEVPRED